MAYVIAFKAVDGRRPDTLTAIFIGVGVLCGIALGAVLATLFRRNGNALSDAGGVNVWNVLGPTPMGALPAPQVLGEPIPVTAAATPQSAAETLSTSTKTLTLNRINPVRILNGGGNRHWKAQIIVIGPPGGTARIATEPNALAFTSMCMILQAGRPVELRVRPTDALFAIGETDGVQISIAASEEPF